MKKCFQKIWKKIETTENKLSPVSCFLSCSGWRWSCSCHQQPTFLRSTANSTDCPLSLSISSFPIWSIVWTLRTKSFVLASANPRSPRDSCQVNLPRQLAASQMRTWVSTTWKGVSSGWAMTEVLIWISEVVKELASLHTAFLKSREQTW